MGFRFTKRIKLLPGVTLNLSKRGVSSVSAGPEGAKVNVATSGRVRTTLSRWGFSWFKFWR